MSVDSVSRPQAFPGLLTLAHLEQQTPFLALHLPTVDAQLEALMAALPGVEIAYAVKCNPDPSVLATLAAGGATFEIASAGELDLALAAGADPARISYSNPVKPAGHIARTFEAGVRTFVVDGPGEVDKLARVAPGCEVVVRVAVDDRSSEFPLSSKFGTQRSEALALLRRAKALGLVPAGLTFHVGSQCLSVTAWAQALDSLTPVMAAAEAEGMRLSVLDVGGGFPARYEDPVPAIEAIGLHTMAALRRLEARGLLPERVLCEPGRFLVAEAAVMVTTVLGRETRPDGEWLFVDCGAYNGLMEAAQSKGRWPFPMSLGRECDDMDGTFTVTGPTCDCSDTVRHHVLLPGCAAEGDRLLIRSAGAYSLAYASAFNGFPVLSTVLV